MRGLGISVKVKVPTEIKTAAKGLPDMTRTADNLTSVLDAANTTAQAIAVAAVFGVIIYALIRKK